MSYNSETVIVQLSFASFTDLNYLEKILPTDADPGFLEYLRNVNANCLVMKAIDEGQVVFPKTPLITVEGPLPVVQLLETTLLNLVNYAR